MYPLRDLVILRSPEHTSPFRRHDSVRAGGAIMRRFQTWKPMISIRPRPRIVHDPKSPSNTCPPEHASNRSLCCMCLRLGARACNKGPGAQIRIETRNYSTLLKTSSDAFHIVARRHHHAKRLPVKACGHRLAFRTLSTMGI